MFFLSFLKLPLLRLVIENCALFFQMLHRCRGSHGSGSKDLPACVDSHPRVATE